MSVNNMSMQITQLTLKFWVRYKAQRQKQFILQMDINNSIHLNFPV